MLHLYHQLLSFQFQQHWQILSTECWRADSDSVLLNSSHHQSGHCWVTHPLPRIIQPHQHPPVTAGGQEGVDVVVVWVDSAAALNLPVQEVLGLPAADVSLNPLEPFSYPIIY